MRTLSRILLSGLLSMSLVAAVQAQGRPGGNNGRAVGGRAGNASQMRPSQASSQRPNQSMRPTTSVQRPSISSSSQRPTTSSSVRPGNQGNGNHNQGSAVRPGNQGNGNHNQGSAVRPGNQGNGNHNQGSAVRPGNQGNGNHNQGSAVRPGNAGNSVRPGNNGNHNNHAVATNRPGSSVSRPGGWNPVKPPHNNWASPSYRPPRPGGGYWAAPVPNRYRIGWWTPPVPPRYSYPVYGAPTLGTILGLTFGSFIDAGINALYAAGYNVAGYANNVIYLTGVNQLGYLWPEVAMNYTNGLLTGSQFSYYSNVPSMTRYNALFNTLCGTYGAPVANTGNTVTWWAGDSTGYITLHYAYANSLQGLPGYYTTLTYTVNY